MKKFFTQLFKEIQTPAFPRNLCFFLLSIFAWLSMATEYRHHSFQLNFEGSHWSIVMFFLFLLFLVSEVYLYFLKNDGVTQGSVQQKLFRFLSLIVLWRFLYLFSDSVRYNDLSIIIFILSGGAIIYIVFSWYFQRMFQWIIPVQRGIFILFFIALFSLAPRPLFYPVDERYNESLVEFSEMLYVQVMNVDVVLSGELQDLWLEYTPYLPPEGLYSYKRVSDREIIFCIYQKGVQLDFLDVPVDTPCVSLARFDNPNRVDIYSIKRSLVSFEGL
ncbi:hypothetical protein COB57_05505 [Candidatus Peregrinibacteria bacterium]|nr:MAG: hypothetical protein COB57_05505 [Candidatus Peregrinibacteria bacterium]